MSTLRIQSLRRQFSRDSAQPAVNGVTLDIPEGHTMAIVGESGSGKTTLLRMIAGLEIPDSGEIYIGGKLVSTCLRITPPEQRGVGLVFQDGALFPHLTIARNIAYGLKRIGRKARAARIEEMLTLVGLSGYGRRYPREVSGGEAQRVALARALAPEPRILLLDEPFSNLDTTLRKQLRDDVRAILKNTRTTSLFVTHDTEDALAIADEIAVMRKGQLLQVGEPAALYRNPCDAYCANLFGPANRLPESFMRGIASPPAPGQMGDGWLWTRPEELEVLQASGTDTLQVEVNEVRFVGERQELKACPCRQPEITTGSLSTLTLYWEGRDEVRPGQILWIKPRHLSRGEPTTFPEGDNDTAGD